MYCPGIDGQATPDDLHACAALQFWTPTILAERGVRDQRVLGLASAAPWAVDSQYMARLLWNSDIAPVR